MRIIFQILLFLILFNAMLVLFSPYFENKTTGDIGENVVNTKSSFMNIDQAMLTNIISSGFGVFLAIIGIGVIGSRVIANFPTGLFVAAGIIISIITGLWAGLSAPLVSITDSYGLSYIYSILMICIGVVATMSVAEIFTGKGDID